MKPNTTKDYQEDIVKHLRHENALPKVLSDMKYGRLAIMQAMTRAADEIESLRKQLKQAKRKS